MLFLGPSLLGIVPHFTCFIAVLKPAVFKLLTSEYAYEWYRSVNIQKALEAIAFSVGPVF